MALTPPVRQPRAGYAPPRPAIMLRGIAAGHSTIREAALFTIRLRLPDRGRANVIAMRSHQSGPWNVQFGPAQSPRRRRQQIPLLGRSSHKHMSFRSPKRDPPVLKVLTVHPSRQRELREESRRRNSAVRSGTASRISSTRTVRVAYRVVTFGSLQPDAPPLPARRGRRKLQRPQREPDHLVVVQVRGDREQTIEQPPSLIRQRGRLAHYGRVRTEGHIGAQLPRHGHQHCLGPHADRGRSTLNWIWPTFRDRHGVSASPMILDRRSSVGHVILTV
jgi:hypothetical protein